MSDTPTSSNDSEHIKNMLITKASDWKKSWLEPPSNARKKKHIGLIQTLVTTLTAHDLSNTQTFAEPLKNLVSEFDNYCQGFEKNKSTKVARSNLSSILEEIKETAPFYDDEASPFETIKDKEGAQWWLDRFSNDRVCDMMMFKYSLKSLPGLETRIDLLEPIVKIINRKESVTVSQEKFNDFLNICGPFSRCVEKALDLIQYSLAEWSLNQILTVNEFENLLFGTAHGTYYVRLSRSEGNIYVLYSDKGEVKYVNILTENGIMSVYVGDQLLGQVHKMSEALGLCKLNSVPLIRPLSAADATSLMFRVVVAEDKNQFMELNKKFPNFFKDNKDTYLIFVLRAMNKIFIKTLNGPKNLTVDYEPGKPNFLTLNGQSFASIDDLLFQKLPDFRSYKLPTTRLEDASIATLVLKTRKFAAANPVQAKVRSLNPSKEVAAAVAATKSANNPAVFAQLPTLPPQPQNNDNTSPRQAPPSSLDDNDPFSPANMNATPQQGPPRPQTVTTSPAPVKQDQFGTMRGMTAYSHQSVSPNASPAPVKQDQFGTMRGMQSYSSTNNLNTSGGYGAPPTGNTGGANPKAGWAPVKQPVAPPRPLPTTNADSLPSQNPLSSSGSSTPNSITPPSSRSSKEIATRHVGKAKFEGQDCTIKVPDEFAVVCKEPVYFLTSIGAPSNLYVKAEMDKTGRIVISGGSPGQIFSWTVEDAANARSAN